MCMDDRICTKRLLKQFVGESGFDDAQLTNAHCWRALYEGEQRALWTYRTTGENSTPRTIDNSYVVLYSSRLLVMVQCHFVVELCVSRICGIDYLFKYVCEDSDRVSVKLVRGQQVYNKIGSFQDARYVSVSEALWKLFQIKVNLTKVQQLCYLTFTSRIIAQYFFREGWGSQRAT